MSRANQYVTLMLDDILANERRLQSLYTNVVGRQFEFLNEARRFQQCALRFLCNLVEPVDNGEDVSSNEVVITQQPTRLTSNSIPSPSGRRHTIPRRSFNQGVRRRTSNASTGVTETLADIIDTVAHNLTRRTNTAFFGSGDASDNTGSLAPSQQQIDSACSTLLYRDCSSNQTSCPIDMVNFLPRDCIMRIDACGHIFRQSNLRRVFRDSPRCPICRHNIVFPRNIGAALGAALSTNVLSTLLDNVPQTFATTVNDSSGNVLEFSMEFGPSQGSTLD